MTAPTLAARKDPTGQPPSFSAVCLAASRIVLEDKAERAWECCGTAVTSHGGRGGHRTEGDRAATAPQIPRGGNSLNSAGAIYPGCQEHCREEELDLTGSSRRLMRRRLTEGNHTMVWCFV